MIKVTVQYNDHLVDIHFPCSETTLRSALMEIHAADDNPPELFITDVIFPEELDHLKDRFEPDENVARKYDRLFHDVYLQLFPYFLAKKDLYIHLRMFLLCMKECTLPLLHNTLFLNQ